MRVLIVNTSEKTGGAAVAANRLTEALNNNGVKAKMLVRDKETDDLTVAGLGGGLRQRWNFLWERWCIFSGLHFSRDHLFELDIANAGSDITRTREFKEADVVHLHWVNQGMLSLRGIKRILDSGKPVVWTMHDFWPATAICHYPHGCRAYRDGGCACCPYLPGHGSRHDMAHRVWRRKEHIWRSRNIIFVTCSRWLASEVKHSLLLTGKHVASVPNAIDTREFRPGDTREARMRLSLPLDRRLILFVSQRTTDRRKGMDYMLDACGRLAEACPDVKDSTAAVILGGHSDEFAGRLPFPVYPIGYVGERQKIIDVYNAADVFVLPSLEDNLPNTVMEAMACGVPCVGFSTGGVPEMIDHRKNGYVAAYKDAADLAEGMRWVLSEADYGELSRNAVRKVMSSYSQQSVAMKYIEIYNQALAYRHYRL